MEIPFEGWRTIFIVAGGLLLLMLPGFLYLKAKANSPTKNQFFVLPVGVLASLFFGIIFAGPAVSKFFMHTALEKAGVYETDELLRKFWIAPPFKELPALANLKKTDNATSDAVYEGYIHYNFADAIWVCNYPFKKEGSHSKLGELSLRSDKSDALHACASFKTDDIRWLNNSLGK